MATDNNEKIGNGKEAIFHPRIVAFCCNYCAYAAADLAGSLRFSYPADLRVVLLPCTGRLDTLEVLHTFERGADGVLVAGCLEGDCHFQEGNLNARRRVGHIQELLGMVGLERERIHMTNLSSAMGGRFAEVSAQFSQTIHQLGGNPLAGRPQPTQVQPEPAVDGPNLVKEPAI